MIAHSDRRRIAGAIGQDDTELLSHVSDIACISEIYTYSKLHRLETGDVARASRQVVSVHARDIVPSDAKLTKSAFVRACARRGMRLLRIGCAGQACRGLWSVSAAQVIRHQARFRSCAAQ